VTDLHGNTILEVISRRLGELGVGVGVGVGAGVRVGAGDGAGER